MNRLYLALAASLLAHFASHNLFAGDYPQWRGPNRDGHSTDTGLLKEWPKDGPKIAWSVDTAGVGYSTVAIKDGRVITQGDIDGVEHILCFREKDGKLLWAVQPEPVKKQLDGRVDEQFAKFDKNADGKLDQLESMAAFGWNFNRYDAHNPKADANAVATQRVTQLFEAFDKNKDGKLDANEIPRAMQNEVSRIDQSDPKADKEKLAKSRAASEIKAADKDGDGKVSEREARGTALRRVFRRADQRKPGQRRGDGFVSAEELKAYYLQREPGRDGLISKAELTKHIARQYPGADGVLTKADLRRYYGGYRNGQGDGPRGTPTIDGERVYALGGNGDLTCLNAADGKTLWHINLQKDLGGGRPGWGYCESPLVLDEMLIVTPGGRNGTLAALRKSDGKVLWRSKAVTQRAHYSSPVLANVGGVKQIVQFARQSVFGVSMDGSKLLWSYKGAANGTANCATPIVADDHVLASSAYGTGTGTVKITGDANQQTAKEVYFLKRLANHHGGLVKVGDYVYGFGRGLMCIHFKTGKIQWQNRSVGKGSLTYADGKLYCLGEGYQLALVEANPEKYVELGRIRLERGRRPAWAHPVVANGRLYIRLGTKLTAYDIKATKTQ